MVSVDGRVIIFHLAYILDDNSEGNSGAGMEVTKEVNRAIAIIRKGLITDTKKRILLSVSGPKTLVSRKM